MNLKECRTLCRQMNIEESIFDPVPLDRFDEKDIFPEIQDGYFRGEPVEIKDLVIDFKWTPVQDFDKEFYSEFEVVPRKPKKHTKRMKHGYTCH